MRCNSMWRQGAAVLPVSCGERLSMARRARVHDGAIVNESDAEPCGAAVGPLCTTAHDQDGASPTLRSWIATCVSRRGSLSRGIPLAARASDLAAPLPGRT